MDQTPSVANPTQPVPPTPPADTPPMPNSTAKIATTAFISSLITGLVVGSAVYLWQQRTAAPAPTASTTTPTTTAGPSITTAPTDPAVPQIKAALPEITWGDAYTGTDEHRSLSKPDKPFLMPGTFIAGTTSEQPSDDYYQKKITPLLATIESLGWKPNKDLEGYGLDGTTIGFEKSVNNQTLFLIIHYSPEFRGQPPQNVCPCIYNLKVFFSDPVTL